MSNLVRIGDAIRDRRKVLKLRLRHVSERTGLSVGYLSSIELGQVEGPSLATLRAIATALGQRLTVTFEQETSPEDYANGVG